MKKILFPTDFSLSSKWAFEYAKAIASYMNASITALHAYHFDYSAIDAMPPELMEAFNQEKADVALQRFKDYTDSITLEEGGIVVENKVKIDHVIKIGFAIDEIVTYSKENDIDLIVMGTKGSHNLPEKLLGSITTNVIRKADCPVLAIPEGASFKGINKIAFAIDYKNGELDAFAQLIDFAKAVHADIHAIHINDGTEDLKPQEHEVTEGNAPVKVTFTTKYNLYLANGLEEFIVDEHIDMLAMVTHKRRFWEVLFKPSRTKNIALHTTVPLLAFHG